MFEHDAVDAARTKVRRATEQMANKRISWWPVSDCLFEQLRQVLAYRGVYVILGEFIDRLYGISSRIHYLINQFPKPLKFALLFNLFGVVKFVAQKPRNRTNLCLARL